MVWQGSEKASATESFSCDIRVDSRQTSLPYVTLWLGSTKNDRIVLKSG
jgi:hypothetical protein